MDSAKRSRIIVDTSTADLSAATTTAGGAHRQRHELATITTTDQDHAHHHRDGIGVTARYPGKRGPGAPPLYRGAVAGDPGRGAPGSRAGCGHANVSCCED